MQKYLFTVEMVSGQSDDKMTSCDDERSLLEVRVSEFVENQVGCFCLETVVAGRLLLKERPALLLNKDDIEEETSHMVETTNLHRLKNSFITLP